MPDSMYRYGQWMIPEGHKDTGGGTAIVLHLLHHIPGRQALSQHFPFELVLRVRRALALLSRNASACGGRPTFAHAPIPPGAGPRRRVAMRPPQASRLRRARRRRTRGCTAASVPSPTVAPRHRGGERRTCAGRRAQTRSGRAAAADSRGSSPCRVTALNVRKIRITYRRRSSTIREIRSNLLL
jgi:hypothetical protein